LQGVLKGTPEGAVILERVMSDEQVVPGDTVLSSGGDQIFPKGLPVGTVTKVSPGREMFLNIQVKPAADLSRLEEVLVVTQKKEQNAVVDNGVRVRAADILAQRLPSVPNKPAADIAVSGSATSENSKVAVPGPVTGPAAKPLSPSDSSGKPKVVQPAGTRPIPSVPGGTVAAPSAAANAVKPGGAHSVPVGSQATPGHSQNGDAPKKAPPKAAAGDPAPTVSPSAGSNSAGSPATPATARPKPPVSQPNPQPPATDDPH
jgi:rod shape-determining protein MreC